jgi:3-isopropylmalate/(R)-2-methylmalate dehydratase small subunit
VSARVRVTGRGIPLAGHDIDTDRIIPARYLKGVTFEGLGEAVFGDARKQDPEHPFNQAAYQGAAVLVVGANFGCGSSREHAPEALRRWGIQGLVGVSFAEIFFGNCTALGIPCLTADPEHVEWLQRAIAREPHRPITLDVEREEVRFGDRVIPGRIPPGTKSQLVTGTWNATGVLLEAGDAIEQVAHRLPYWGQAFPASARLLGGVGAPPTS